MQNAADLASALNDYQVRCISLLARLTHQGWWYQQSALTSNTHAPHTLNTHVDSHQCDARTWTNLGQACGCWPASPHWHAGVSTVLHASEALTVCCVPGGCIFCHVYKNIRPRSGVHRLTRSSPGSVLPAAPAG